MVLGTSKESAGTAVFVHGITWTRYGMLKYMGPFIDRGWNVLAVDLPGHGDSPRGNRSVPAYGYHEKYDIDAVVDWVRNRFGTNRPVILVGESMGAGTVLQYAPLGAAPGTDPSTWKVQAIIADCPYSSAADELDARLADTGIPRFIAKPAAISSWIFSCTCIGVTTLRIHHPKLLFYRARFPFYSFMARQIPMCQPGCPRRWRTIGDRYKRAPRTCFWFLKQAMPRV
jgi:pimeloyl-ACP methyl ester carboxylesterase